MQPKTEGATAMDGEGADARERIIAEVMRDDPELTRKEAEALYDQAIREGA